MMKYWILMLSDSSLPFQSSKDHHDVPCSQCVSPGGFCYCALLEIILLMLCFYPMVNMNQIISSNFILMELKLRFLPWASILRYTYHWPYCLISLESVPSLQLFYSLSYALSFYSLSEVLLVHLAHTHSRSSLHSESRRNKQVCPGFWLHIFYKKSHYEKHFQDMFTCHRQSPCSCGVYFHQGEPYYLNEDVG